MSAAKIVPNFSDHISAAEGCVGGQSRDGEPDIDVSVVCGQARGGAQYNVQVWIFWEVGALRIVGIDSVGGSICRAACMIRGICGVCGKDTLKQKRKWWREKA